MLDNIDLVEEYERVEDGEGRIVEYSCEDNVFYVLKTVGVMDLLPYVGLFDVDDFFESRVVREVLSMVCFVAWEVRVIYVLLVQSKHVKCA